eukprot:g5322.t1
MTKQSYEMIEEQAGGGLRTAAAGEDGESGSLLSSSATPPSLHQRRVALAVVTLVAGMLLVVLAVQLVGYASSSSLRPNARGEDTAAANPMQASIDSFPSCSLMSCTSSGCDWDGAPFLCLEGRSTGGCADKAATWSEGDSCTSVCDLSGCADTLERAGSDGGQDLPRRCLDCDEKQCSKLAEQWSQACGKAAPFVCLSGAATWGCADTELAWASAPSTTCGECCDIGGC